MFFTFFGLFENTKLWWRFSRLFGVFLEILHAMMTLFLFGFCRYRFSACYGDIFPGLSQAAIFLGKNWPDSHLAVKIVVFAKTPILPKLRARIRFFVDFSPKKQGLDPHF